MNGLTPDALAQQYGSMVSALARRMIWDSAIAEEAAQETWIQVLQALPTFKGDSSVKTWIYSITRRTLWRYLQKENQVSQHAQLTEGQFETHFSKEEIQYSGSNSKALSWAREQCDHCLTAFCHCLNVDARMIFLFRVLAVLSDSEIAKIMDSTESSVRKIFSRSRQKVQHFMDGDCYLYNPKGNCRCRIKTHLEKINIKAVHQELSEALSVIEFFQIFHQSIPPKNYWLKFFENKSS